MGFSECLFLAANVHKDHCTLQLLPQRTAQQLITYSPQLHTLHVQDGLTNLLLLHGHYVLLHVHCCNAY
jgi:hypothetical protein